MIPWWFAQNLLEFQFVSFRTSLGEITPYMQEFVFLPFGFRINAIKTHWHFVPGILFPRGWFFPLILFSCFFCSPFAKLAQKDAVSFLTFWSGPTYAIFILALASLVRYLEKTGFFGIIQKATFRQKKTDFKRFFPFFDFPFREIWKLGKNLPCFP